MKDYVVQLDLTMDPTLDLDREIQSGEENELIEYLIGACKHHSASENVSVYVVVNTKREELELDWTKSQEELKSEIKDCIARLQKANRSRRF